MKYSLNIALLISLCLATGLHARAEDPMTFFEAATPLQDGLGPNSGRFMPVEYFYEDGIVSAAGVGGTYYFRLSTRTENVLPDICMRSMERYTSFIGRWYIPGTNTDITLLRCEDEIPENDTVLIYIYEPATEKGHLFGSHTYYHKENESQNPAEYLRYNIENNTLILKTYQENIIQLKLPFVPPLPFMTRVWTRVMNIVGTAGEIFELTHGID